MSGRFLECGSLLCFSITNFEWRLYDIPFLFLVNTGAYQKEIADVKARYAKYRKMADEA